MVKRIAVRGSRNASEVLATAHTEWNFLKFTLGPVGGDCICGAPYYLASQALKLGYHPETISSSRRISDGMASHVASRLAPNPLQLIKASDMVCDLKSAHAPHPSLQERP